MNDAYDLACHLCGLHDGADYDVLEEKLWNEYSLELESFQKVVGALLPLIDIARSPLTGELYKGFADTSNGYGLWLVKTAVRSACDESGDTHE